MNDSAVEGMLPPRCFGLMSQHEWCVVALRLRKAHSSAVGSYPLDAGHLSASSR